MTKINIDKFICYIIEDTSLDLDIRTSLIRAIRNQGFTVKYGEIVEIDQPPLTEEQKAKFKAGDWLVENEPNNYARFVQILEIVDVQGDGRYRISRDIHNDEDVSGFRFIEKYYHAFNIQDAKAGDVLINEFHLIFIFKEIRNNTFVSYCSVIERGIDSIINSIAEREVGDVSLVKVMPVTKEQRDILFKAIEKEGYKWNQEELRLEEIDKPQTIKFNKEEVKKIAENTEYFSGEREPMTNAEKRYFDKMLFDDVRYKPIDFDKVDIDKMVEEYKDSLNSAFLPLGYYPSQLNEFTKVYKRGLEDMLKVFKGGD